LLKRSYRTKKDDKKLSFIKFSYCRNFETSLSFNNVRVFRVSKYCRMRVFVNILFNNNKNNYSYFFSQNRTKLEDYKLNLEIINKVQISKKKQKIFFILDRLLIFRYVFSFSIYREISFIRVFCRSNFSIRVFVRFAFFANSIFFCFERLF